MPIPRMNQAQRMANIEKFVRGTLKKTPVVSLLPDNCTLIKDGESIRDIFFRAMVGPQGDVVYFNMGTKDMNKQIFDNPTVGVERATFKKVYDRLKGISAFFVSMQGKDLERYAGVSKTSQFGKDGAFKSIRMFLADVLPDGKSDFREVRLSAKSPDLTAEGGVTRKMFQDGKQVSTFERDFRGRESLNLTKLLLVSDDFDPARRTWELGAKDGFFTDSFMEGLLDRNPWA